MNSSIELKCVQCHAANNRPTTEPGPEPNFEYRNTNSPSALGGVCEHQETNEGKTIPPSTSGGNTNPTNQLHRGMGGIQNPAKRTVCLEPGAESCTKYDGAEGIVCTTQPNVYKNGEIHDLRAECCCLTKQTRLLYQPDEKGVRTRSNKKHI